MRARMVGDSHVWQLMLAKAKRERNRPNQTIRRPLLRRHILHRRTLQERKASAIPLGVSDGDLNIDAWGEGDGGDLLDDVGARVEVDEALVDAHFEAVPGIGTLTARGLAGSDAQALGGHAHRASHTELAVSGALLQVRAHLLQVLNVQGGQGDADAVLLRCLLVNHLGDRLFDANISRTSRHG